MSLGTNNAPFGGMKRSLSVPHLKNSDLMSLTDASFNALLEEQAAMGVLGSGVGTAYGRSPRQQPQQQPTPLIKIPGADGGAHSYARGSKLSLGSSSSSGDKKKSGGGGGGSGGTRTGSSNSKTSSATSAASAASATARMSPLSETSAAGHHVKRSSATQPPVPVGSSLGPVTMSGLSSTAMGAPFHPVQSDRMLQSSLLTAAPDGGPGLSASIGPDDGSGHSGEAMPPPANMPHLQRAERTRTQTGGSSGGSISRHSARSGSVASVRSRESGSWIDAYRSMASVGSDMYTWNEEGSGSRNSIMSEISADLMALDLAGAGGVGDSLLPPLLGPEDAHASEDTMDVANTST